jgi:hypothetical protein
VAGHVGHGAVLEHLADLEAGRIEHEPVAEVGSQLGLGAGLVVVLGDWRVDGLPGLAVPRLPLGDRCLEQLDDFVFLDLLEKRDGTLGVQQRALKSIPTWNQSGSSLSRVSTWWRTSCQGRPFNLMSV